MAIQRRFVYCFTLWVCGALAVSSRTMAAEEAAKEQLAARVAKLLERKCLECHGAEKQEGGLRLDSSERMRAGGDSGIAIKPGSADASLLIQAVRHENGLSMPPKQRLTEEEVALLTDWVSRGAPDFPNQIGVVVTRVDSSEGAVGDAWSDKSNPIRKLFEGERLDLWSLKPPVRREPPTVRNTGWPRTPIDSFILAALETKGLRPSAEADRRTLIRRLTFDLHGLPPTPEEVQSFVAEQSPDAYEQLVERLLASPRYGERWGRHWLDVVRYADSNGYERDEFRPTMWRYRDYVIRAFNDDKPYDEFVREQLAGDELAAAEPGDARNPERLVATGYLRSGAWDSTKEVFAQKDLAHDEVLVDLTNTTAAAFLAQTFSCCRCHDHKNDPFSHDDHFRLRAFFAAVKFEEHVVDPADRREEIDRHNALIAQHIAGIEQQRTKLLAAAKERLLAERRAKLPEDVLAALSVPETERNEETRKKLEPHLPALNVSDDDARNALGDDDRKRYDDAGKNIADISKQKRGYSTACGMTDQGRDAPATFVQVQGDHKKPKHEVQPGFPSLLKPSAVEVSASALGATTGRRLALANWIASAENPWTARVLVNRVWQHHFDRGIVATPDDFGYSGARPTHPELLDWLAVEFRQNGWSIKHLHRLIVLSSTYRQSAADDEARRKIDPDNALLWRQNARRLDAEALRDTLLAASGRLRSKASGPPLWPPVPQEILNAQPSIYETTDRLQGYYADPAEATDVRSVFLVRKRAIPLPFLQAFDAPDPNSCVGRRQVTTVAPQALVLMNNPLSIRLSQAFAARLRQDAGGDLGEQLNRAIWLAYARAPAESEIALFKEHFGRLVRLHAERLGGADSAGANSAALDDLCRAIINTNEFVSID